MYARLVRFSFGPGKHAVAQAIADELAPMIATRPGNQGVTVFGDEGDGEYGIFILWDSEDSANAAAPVIRPVLDGYLEGNVQGFPSFHLYKVLSK